MSYTIELVLNNILLLANIAIQYIFIWENPFKSIGRFALNINGFMEMGPLWLAEYMQNFPNALQAQFMIYWWPMRFHCMYRVHALLCCPENVPCLHKLSHCINAWFTKPCGREEVGFVWNSNLLSFVKVLVTSWLFTGK